ncbi:MAG: 50S ribosomal protein L22 [Planctomycetota bacterium]|nr:MAG: 50S ribosomal protein L22 [Planctomycetota bacterium]
MEFRATHRYAHMSARKARPAANMIRGLDVNRALILLDGHHTRGASIFQKVLRSAIANAGQNDAINVDRLVVSDARVDEGPLIHGRPRFRPGPMGRAMPLRRRTSHFRIAVSEKGAN